MARSSPPPHPQPDQRHEPSAHHGQEVATRHPSEDSVASARREPSSGASVPHHAPVRDLRSPEPPRSTPPRHPATPLSAPPCLCEETRSPDRRNDPVRGRPRETPNDSPTPFTRKPDRTADGPRPTGNEADRIGRGSPADARRPNRLKTNDRDTAAIRPPTPQATAALPRSRARAPKAPRTPTPTTSRAARAARVVHPPASQHRSQTLPPSAETDGTAPGAPQQADTIEDKNSDGPRHQTAKASDHPCAPTTPRAEAEGATPPRLRPRPRRLRPTVPTPSLPTRAVAHRAA
jgi:hypothetical protein